MGLIENSVLRIKTLNVSDYALISIFGALMALTTAYAVPLPFGGLTHFGNMVMWTAAILLGGLVGGLAGGIGGMIVDILEAPIWAPFTPFCKLVSGLACGLVAGDSTKVNTVKIVRIIAATIVGWAFNILAYAPVYYILIDYPSMVAWLLLFFGPTPATIVTLVGTPILSLGVLKAYPGISTYRDGIKNRIKQYKEAKAKK